MRYVQIVFALFSEFLLLFQGGEATTLAMGEGVMKPLLVKWLQDWINHPKTKSEISKSWQMVLPMLFSEEEEENEGLEDIGESSESDSEVEVNLSGIAEPEGLIVSDGPAERSPQEVIDDQQLADLALAEALARGQRILPARKGVSGQRLG